ncbi:hypothetical protein H2203_005151 [Taxawa tesnikishii (nom. ined.)]|nr:hypothetical protein H2203_005151 [Dothideales sp. JES 119]
MDSRRRLGPQTSKGNASGQPKKISSQALLRCETEDEAEKYIVLMSPLFDHESKQENTSGLLAQPFPKQDRQDRKQDGPSEELRKLKYAADGGTIGNSGVNGKTQGPPLDISELGIVAHNVPLDEHPSFFRFAAMLLSGLTILDHKAQAIFRADNGWIGCGYPPSPVHGHGWISAFSIHGYP